MNQRVWHSIAEVRKVSSYWFLPKTMKFFRSRIESGIINKRHFITSEQFEDSQGQRDERRYTVRIVNDNGSIDTLGDFQTYSTKEEAKAAARKI